MFNDRPSVGHSFRTVPQYGAKMLTEHPSVGQKHSRSALVCSKDVHGAPQRGTEMFTKCPNVGQACYNAPQQGAKMFIKHPSEG